MTPLRVGVWFDASHCCYGGPTVVLLGTLLGLKRLGVTVLLNEPGDVNWTMNNDRLANVVCRAPRLVIGPMAPSMNDEEDYTKNPVWIYGKDATVVVPTEWVRQFVCHGMPYDDGELRGNRRLSLWPSGVDTDFFSPLSQGQKTQDFFIYYKSQRHADLHRIHTLLFKSHFQLRGSVLAYYCYTPEMLRLAARSSRFCIVLNSTETQGLAMLEIMACDCPLFVLDSVEHKGKRVGMTGASSCPCWSAECGVKTSWDNLETDFPAFLTSLSSYRPREFVESAYSYEAAAASLLRIMGSAP